MDAVGAMSVFDAEFQARPAEEHTPGPWVVEGEGWEYGVYREPTVVAGHYADYEPRTVASVRVGLDETDANARLMAAAPEMLAALRVVDAFRRLMVANGDAIAFTPGFKYMAEAAHLAIVKAALR